MKLTFLGTGSAIPSERMQSGLLIEDDPLLFDCGSGVLHNLNRSDVRVDDVENVLFTHCHLDHVNDLMALIKADWLLGRTELSIYGPPGLYDTVESMFDVYDYLRGRVDVEVNEVSPGSSFELLGHDIETTETEHSVTSMAYRVDDDFVYTGDTEAFDGIAEFASGCEVLVHECSFPNDVDVGNHTRPSTLAPVLEDCDVDEVYLTHLYPHTRGREQEMLDELRESFDGEVEIAEDMYSVDIGARLRRLR
ncbi:MAG: MBL fold metallo-hydrolase [Halobacteriota archaeon]